MSSPYKRGVEERIYKMKLDRTPVEWNTSSVNYKRKPRQVPEEQTILRHC